jgi:hypothetical protein
MTVTGRCFSWRLEATGTEQRTHCTRPMVCHGIQRLHHQLAGELDLRLESFHRANDHEQTPATYYAELGSPSAEALRLLASWAPTRQEREPGCRRHARLDEQLIIGSWPRATPSVPSHARRLRGRCRIQDGAGVLRVGRGRTVPPLRRASFRGPAGGWPPRTGSGGPTSPRTSAASTSGPRPTS